MLARIGLLYRGQTPRLANGATPARAVATLALAAFGVLGVLGCSSGESPPESATTSTPTSNDGSSTTVAPPAIEATLRIGTTAIFGFGTPANDPPQIPRPVTRSVIATVDSYVDAAFLAPLRGEDIVLDGIVGPRAAARLASGRPDRAVMTNDGLPEVTRAKVQLAPSDLSALSEGFGRLSFVSATLDLETDLSTVEGALSVHQFGEIVLARDGEEWRVIGYEMIVVRDDGTSTITTTAAVAP